MCEQNAELVRGFYEALARGEFPAELLDEGVEYVNPAGAIEPGTRRGVSAVRRAIERVYEGWASWEMEPERLEAVADLVAVVVRYAARGRSSGLEVEGRESALFTVSHGKITRYEWFHEPTGALERLTAGDSGV